jgi:hypothetical protein
VTILLLEGEHDDARVRAGELVASLDPAPGRHVDTTARSRLAITEAAGLILAIVGRDSEALRLLVAVGAHGRIWQARQEGTFVLHREYSKLVAERLGPDATARAGSEGEAMTVEEMQAAVDALVAEA